MRKSRLTKANRVIIHRDIFLSAFSEPLLACGDNIDDDRVLESGLWYLPCGKGKRFACPDS